MEEKTKRLRPGINYTYMIFITPQGKGYGCFAIEQVNDSEYKLAASFCHPNDRKLFSKALAREIAARNLTKVGDGKQPYQLYSIDKDVGVDNKTVIYKAIEDGENPFPLPSWAKRAYVRDAYAFSLSLDNQSVDNFIDFLDLAPSFVRELMRNVAIKDYEIDIMKKAALAANK
jgi:hypothetical protein